MSANSVYDNHMISVYTRDAAKNVYKKFQADLPDWCGCWTDTMFVFYPLFIIVVFHTLFI